MLGISSRRNGRNNIDHDDDEFILVVPDNDHDDNNLGIGSSRTSSRRTRRRIDNSLGTITNSLGRTSRNSRKSGTSTRIINLGSNTLDTDLNHVIIPSTR